MKRLEPLGPVILLALFLLAPSRGCSGPAVDILYDRDADFTAYETYRWETSAPEESAVGQLIDQRIKTTVAEELEPKGLRPAAEGESPDLLLSYYGWVEDDLRVEGVRYELAPHVVWTGAAPMEVTRSSRAGTLILDLVDATSRRVVWSGVVSDRARDTTALRDKVEPAVEKLLRRYPPPSSSTPASVRK